MNRYSLAADDNRWWWTSAVAGVLGTSAVAAILMLPANSGGAPADRAPGTSDIDIIAPAPPDVRPCFMWRSNRGAGWDGFQPTCPLDTDTHDPAPVSPGRPGLDFGP
jgi:hypothetical protein